VTEPESGYSAQRVAVLSDVHGNAVALRAALAEMRSAEPDLVVFGGDLTWGPLPAETLALLREVEIPSVYVRGNAERALLERSPEPTARELWLYDLHTEDDLLFLASFAEAARVEIKGLGSAYFCHGSPRGDEELVTPKTPAARIRALSAGISEHVLVTAHTHLQFDRRIAGIRSVNPGSVGMPYEGKPGAFWAVLGPDVDLRCTKYSLQEASELYGASRDPLAQAMVDVLVNPPTRAEVIADAESRKFAG
jgi:putative phosphoesterase